MLNYRLKTFQVRYHYHTLNISLGCYTRIFLQTNETDSSGIIYSKAANHDNRFRCLTKSASTSLNHFNIYTRNYGTIIVINIVCIYSIYLLIILSSLKHTHNTYTKVHLQYSFSFDIFPVDNKTKQVFSSME